MKILDWLDSHFVANWQQVLKAISLELGVLCAAGASVWISLPDDQHAALLALVHIDPKWAVPVGVVGAVYLRLKG